MWVLRAEEDENAAIWGLTDLGNANFGKFGRCVGVFGVRRRGGGVVDIICVVERQ